MKDALRPKLAPAVPVASGSLARAAAVLFTLTLLIGLNVTSSAKGGRAGTTGVIYVMSQGLYYDTFATADPLPMEGRFQLLVDGVTDFGPGDPGYLGGRWWVDLNGNDIQDPDDRYFLCPLLGPGRESP
jgi:hypothetical protein